MSKQDECKRATEIMKKAISPKGFSILVELLENSVSATFSGKEIDYDTGEVVGSSIVIPSNILEKEREMLKVGEVYVKVIKLGPDCYTRMDFDTNEKWCKPGDLIRMAQYGGEKIKTPSGITTNLLLINDADVVAELDEDLLETEGLLRREVDLSANITDIEV